ncbi:MAG: hypothetical protein AAF492_05445 [Verrucomicrobiota bacterium]
MGTGRKFRKNTMTRPTKTGRDKRRRQETQRKRLISLGVDEETVNKMNVKEIRDMLKRPAKIGS